MLTMPNSSARWFISPRYSARAGTRLFFFPYAGGGPAVFAKWAAELPNEIEGWAAHLPGRGSRYSETSCSSLMTLVEELGQAIQPLLDRPYAFFGHSFGALVAFELAREIRRCDLLQPGALFVSACRAPHMPDPHPSIHALPEAEFLEELKKFNGIPAEVSRETEVIDILLPAVRADFEAFETYNYVPQAPLDYRIIALGGDADPHVNRGELDAWASQTNSSFQTEYFPGDHFFINTARESIIRYIVAEMRRSSPI